MAAADLRSDADPRRPGRRLQAAARRGTRLARLQELARAAPTWRNLRHELDRMHLVTLATGDGHVAQRTTSTAGHKTILAALDLPEPPKFFEFTLTNT